MKYCEKHHLNFVEHSCPACEAERGGCQAVRDYVDARDQKERTHEDRTDA